MVVANLKGSSFIEDATATRPNCFALRRQVMILQKAGGGSAERQAAETRCKKGSGVFRFGFATYGFLTLNI